MKGFSGFIFVSLVLLAIPSLVYSCERCEALEDGVLCQYGYMTVGESCVSNIDSCFTLGSCEDSSLPPFPPWAPPLPPDWPPENWPIDPTGNDFLALYPSEKAQCRISPCGKEPPSYVGFHESQIEKLRMHSSLLAKVLLILRSSDAGGIPVSAIQSGAFIPEEGRAPIHFRGQIAVGKEFEIQVYFEFFGHPEISSLLAVFSSATSGRRLVGSIEEELLNGDTVTIDF